MKLKTIEIPIEMEEGSEVTVSFLPAHCVLL